MTLSWELNIGDLLAVVVAIIAASGAIYIGIQQNKINKRLLALQDAIDVYLEIGFRNAIVKEKEMLVPVIMVHNISTLPVSLVGYTFNGIERNISAYRLPPAAQFPNAHYFIYLPLEDIDYVSFLLEFEDFFKRKWSVKGFAEIRNGRWEISSQMPACKNADAL